GVLDFAVFDPTEEDSLRLHRSGGRIGPGGLAGPVAFLANYFFDTTPHDCFAVERGALQECCPRITCEGPRPEEGEPDLLSRISIEFDRRPADPEPYDDDDWNAVLRGYAGRLDDTVLTFPVSVLRSLKNLAALAGGRMMLLVGDEGRLREEDLLGQP